MQLVTLVCGFILPRMILEQYGSEVNGLTQSIAQFLGVITFLELGVGQVIQSALYKPLAEKNNEKVSSILASGGRFFSRIAWVLLAYAAVLTAVYPLLIDRSFGWTYTAALIAAISINSFAQYLFGIVDKLLLNADQRGYVQYISQIGATLLNTLICIFLIRAGQSIQMVKFASALIYLVRPWAVRMYVKRHYSIDRNVRYAGEPIQQKWNGIAQHVAAVILEGTDTVVLTLFATLSDVSIYSVYYMVIHGIMQFYQAATAGLQSAVGALWAKQELDQLNRVFGCLETALHFVTVLLFSCTGILILPFVQVYTEGLTDAQYQQPLFSAILVLAYWVRCVRTPYNILILAGGHYKQTQTCHILAAAINLIVSVLAVKAWGLVGVALGTLASLVYQTLWMVVYDSRHLLKWPLQNFFRQLCADLLTFGLIYLATMGIGLGEVSYLGWFVMALKVGVIALVITAVVAFLFYRRRFTEMGKWYLRRKAANL